MGRTRFRQNVVNWIWRRARGRRRVARTHHDPSTSWRYGKVDVATRSNTARCCNHLRLAYTVHVFRVVCAAQICPVDEAGMCCLVDVERHAVAENRRRRRRWRWRRRRRRRRWTISHRVGDNRDASGNNDRRHNRRANNCQRECRDAGHARQPRSPERDRESSRRQWQQSSE